MLALENGAIDFCLRSFNKCKFGVTKVIRCKAFGINIISQTKVSFKYYFLLLHENSNRQILNALIGNYIFVCKLIKRYVSF